MTAFGEMAGEADRLAAARRYGGLDTPPEDAFDRIARLAAHRLDVPIALICIVDAARIRVEARHGVSLAEVPRAPGLCASVVLGATPLVLPDTRRDRAARANPLVRRRNGWRFYAGAPLLAPGGHAIGTLCVADRTPRTPDPVRIVDLVDLVDLAALAMALMEQRLAAAEALAAARETDHRVMNGLQSVSSLISMQARAGADGPAAALERAAVRIAAMARVHRHLYRAEAGPSSCLGFLERLCADLSDLLGAGISVLGEEGAMVGATLQPVGLIVNELVTNAAKHAGGGIAVSVAFSDGVCTLCVSDEGAGLPPGFVPGAGEGFGMKVVVALADRLGGALAFGANPAGRGARVTLVFPIARGPGPHAAKG